MDEESSMSSFNDENDENLIDKENQRNRDSDAETDEHQRTIYEQQQYQRTQFYERTYRHGESASHDDDDQGDVAFDDRQSIDESVDESTRPAEPVPEYLIEKIDTERWPFVNGHYDDKGEWKEWNQISTAMNTYSGELVTIFEYTIC